MNIMFIGADHEVTGSCTMLQVNGKHILVDCGLEQGADIYENCTIPVAPPSLDAILVTHAHIDHSGKLPVMTAGGFRGPIYATEATARLCAIMLRDSAHIQESEAEWRNRKAQRSGGEAYVPLYTVADAEATIPLFRTFGYGTEFTVCEGVKACFYDAGHLLGSASILFTITENGETRTILFSGDVGNPGRPILKEFTTPPHADYAVIESTYGDRLHSKAPDYIGQLTRVFQETFDRGGNVVIPSFAVGRTQELLYLIRIIKEKGLVKGHGNFPVWIDSPLAVEATSLYSPELAEYYNDETRSLISGGVNPLDFPGLNMSVTSDDSKAINADRQPKVIISASGMCEAGRIRHHLKHNLWREECTVVFVGFQTEGTLGSKLLRGEKLLTLFGEEIAVHASIRRIDSFSSHADRGRLLSWLDAVKPGTVFVNHGEDSVCEGFANTVRMQQGYDAVAPYSGDIYDLVTGECIEKAAIRKVQTKKTASARRAKTVYEKLVNAGMRLLSVIEKYKGAPNKEIAGLTDKIQQLIEKYDR